MANIFVGIVVFGSLAAIIRSMVKNKKRTGGNCHSGCATCPFACDKRHD